MSKNESKKEEKKENLCSRCEIPGHKLKDCPVPENLFSLNSLVKPEKKLCDHCGKKGHESDTCLKKFKVALKYELSVT